MAVWNFYKWKIWGKKIHSFHFLFIMITHKYQVIKLGFPCMLSSRTRSTQGRQFLPGFTGDLHHSAWWVWNVRRKSLFPGRTLQDPKLLRKGHEQPVTTVLKRCAILLGAPNFPNPRLLDGELLKRKKRKCFTCQEKKKKPCHLSMKKKHIFI